MKDTFKVAITIIGIAFTLTVIAWLAVIAILLITWFGGII